MKLTRGDVVIAVFPKDLGKPRPAVILQPEEFTMSFTTVLACPITTRLIDAPLLRPIIAPTVDNGLQEFSQIMVEKISPVRKDVIRQTIGRLSEVDMKRVDTALIHVTGLAYSTLSQSNKEQTGEQP